MRPLLLAAFLGSTALAAGAAAQTQPQVTPGTVPQGQAQAKAAIAECDRLASLLESSPANAGVTLEQVRAWQRANEVGPCRDNLQRLNQAAGGSSGSGIQPVSPQASSANPAGPAPSPAPAPAGAAGTSGASAPQVVVQQAQPNVTVRQAQPEVIVRMPPPVITVQQPQPEIIVRMPQPDVNVAMERPEVRLVMPQPQIQVLAPQQGQAQPNVQVDGGQPNVRVERTGEPRIVYQQAEGQPMVRFEPMDQAASPQGQAAPAAGLTTAQQPVAASPNPQSQSAASLSPQGAQAQLNARRGAAAEPQQTGALPAQQIAASKLEDMSLYNAAGEKMGDVEEVMTGPENRLFVVISHGGFLGLGQKQVAMPVEQLAMRGDRLVAEGLTDDQIKAMPAFDDGQAGYKEAADDHATSLRVLQ